MNIPQSVDVKPLGFQTFVLGVGAQKSGTTWLYQYLARHPQVQMAGLKELHVFDSYYKPDLFGEFEKRLQRKLDAKKAGQKGGATATPQLVKHAEKRLAINNDIHRYLDFFRAYDINAMASGDVTPTYMALEAEQFTEVRNLMIDAGLSVRVILLMRDPVARALSSAKMAARNMNLKDDAEIKAHFLKNVNHPGIQKRGEYHVAIKNLREAFEPDELFMEFYEHFFDHAVIRRLCDFLGLNYVEGDLDHVPNRTSKVAPLTAEEHAIAYNALSDVYDGCREIFGDKVPEKWAKGPGDVR